MTAGLRDLTGEGGWTHSGTTEGASAMDATRPRPVMSPAIASCFFLPGAWCAAPCHPCSGLV